MNNNLMIFENPEFGAVRSILIDGDPWFVGKDVASSLGYSNHRKALLDHVDGEDKLDGVTIRDPIGRGQKPIFISESGLYSLILSSKLERAKKFKRWITHEVIPSIRKHGAYMTKSVLEQVLENPELVLLMAQRMLEEQRKNELLQQELRLAKPKADFYDAFIHPECCTNLRATAKELKVPEKMFTAFLIRKRYLYRAPSGTLLPYAKPASDGLFFVKDYIAVNGHQGVYTLVTPKGKSLFLTMLGEIA